MHVKQALIYRVNGKLMATQQPNSAATVMPAKLKKINNHTIHQSFTVTKPSVTVDIVSRVV